MKALKNKVIGFGKPRSGTTSLAAALGILGLNITQWCPITSKTGQQEALEAIMGNMNGCDGLVTSHYDASTAYSLIHHYPEAYYIICQRDETTRKISMSNLGYDSVYSDSGDLVPQILQRVKNVLFLDLELSGKDKWNLICDFLSLEIPTCDYPHKNSSEFNFSI